MDHLIADHVYGNVQVVVWCAGFFYLLAKFILWVDKYAEKRERENRLAQWDRLWGRSK